MSSINWIALFVNLVLAAAQLFVLWRGVRMLTRARKAVQDLETEVCKQPFLRMGFVPADDPSRKEFIYEH